MKNVLISLVALAALSGAAAATERNYDLRESDTYFGKFSEQLKGDRLPYANSGAEAFAAGGDSAPLTAFERMTKISEENDNGRH